MKKTLIEEIERIHSITYGPDILSEQNFLNKILQGIGLKKQDDPKKADFVTPDINNFYDTLDNAANSGGLSEQQRGSMVYQKAVEAMQIGLILLGYDLPRYGVDGLFGPETAGAVDRFKKSNNIVSDNTQATPETLKLIIQQLKGKNITQKDIQPHLDKVITNVPPTAAGKQIMDFFINKGLTPEQAAGIAGNLYKESGFNPKAVGDNGTSYGIAQWHLNRFENLKRYPNWDTIDGQLNYLWYELNTTEKKSLYSLKQATTPQEAAAIFARDFERGLSSNFRPKESAAQNIYINYTQNIA